MSDISPTPAAMQAQIYSQGYRGFHGFRRGLASSMWAVTVQSMRYMLGIGRSAWTKVVPIILVLFRSLNAIATLGIGFFLGADFFEEMDFSLSAHVSGSLQVVVLFLALAAPAILVNDRRSGMYDMYLTTNLTMPTYLVSKAASLVLVLTGFILVPAAITFLGFTLFGIGPDGFVNWLLTAARILAASMVVAAMFTALAMAVSAVAKRALIAGLAIIGILIGGGVIAGVMVEGLDYGPSWGLLSVVYTAFAANSAVFGEALPHGVEAPLVWLAVAAHVLVPSIIVWIVYRNAGEDR